MADTVLKRILFFIFFLPRQQKKSRNETNAPFYSIQHMYETADTVPAKS